MSSSVSSWSSSSLKSTSAFLRPRRLGVAFCDEARELVELFGVVGADRRACDGSGNEHRACE